MRTGLTAAAFVLAAVIVIAACVPVQPQKNETKAGFVECVADSDCGVGGCSGQICATAAEAPGIITTCEYRAEYDCLKLTSCGCVNEKCAWKETPELKSCFDAVKSRQ